MSTEEKTTPELKKFDLSPVPPRASTRATVPPLRPPTFLIKVGRRHPGWPVYPRMWVPLGDRQYLPWP